MDFQIVWSRSALSDLQAVCEYLAEHDPDAARRIGKRLVDHVRMLGGFPEIGPVYRPCGDSNVREILCLQYRIFYQISEAKKQVEILQVWHGAQDEPPLGQA